MPEPDLDRWARQIEEQPKGSVGLGLGLTLVLHIVFQSLPFLMYMGVLSRDGGLISGLLPLAFIGLSQLVYMAPAILVFRRRGYIDTVKGLVLGGSITMLLNSACIGLIFFNR
jgi:hypothetical protein